MSSWGTPTVSVHVDGTQALARHALKLGVSVADMTAFNARQAKPIAALARSLAPSRTGRLRAGIRPVRSKNRVSVRLGNRTSLAYAAVVHWGRDGHSGPQFLPVAEERLRTTTLNAYDREMRDLLHQNGFI